MAVGLKRRHTPLRSKGGLELKTPFRGCASGQRALPCSGHTNPGHGDADWPYGYSERTAVYSNCGMPAAITHIHTHIHTELAANWIKVDPPYDMISGTHMNSWATDVRAGTHLIPAHIELCRCLFEGLLHIGRDPLKTSNVPAQYNTTIVRHDRCMPTPCNECVVRVRPVNNTPELILRQQRRIGVQVMHDPGRRESHVSDSVNDGSSTLFKPTVTPAAVGNVVNPWGGWIGEVVAVG